MSEIGWVRLHRKLFDNKLWLSEPFTKAQAWIDLFANANHNEGSFWVRGNEVVIKRGELGWSELTMCKRWSWSKNKVRRFLKWLETEHQIVQQKSYLTSVIAILNYELYQTTDKTEHLAKQQKDSRRYTNKNEKNEKNEKNTRIGERGVAPIGATPSEEASSFFEGGKVFDEVKDTLNKRMPADTANKELSKFASYWTEPNKSGTRVRWQLERTFDIRRRLQTWFDRVPSFMSKSKGKNIIM